MKRAIVIVLDGCGAGFAPDAEKFGDADQPNTLAHVWDRSGGLDAPNLIASGFFAAAGVREAVPVSPSAAYGRLQELSQGKDSVTGHWEMMGVWTKEPFPTYPQGFPTSLIQEFERKIGVQTLGNKPASGTAILDELGEEHRLTGHPIVYTSADSVFQIACHEEAVPIETLYDYCRTAREMLVAPNNVQRVIARPFIGSKAEGFTRTTRRKDFPLEPPVNLVDTIGQVHGIGVVPELFGGRGFLPVRRTQSNLEHEKALEEALNSESRFIFANFEDFDMLYGHRNDPEGFGRALVDFDRVLGTVLSRLGEEDLLILTADHGNDPTSPSTDHSREYVPFVRCGKGIKVGPQPDAPGMWHVGQAVCGHLGIDYSFEKG